MAKLVENDPQILVENRVFFYYRVDETKRGKELEQGRKRDVDIDEIFDQLETKLSSDDEEEMSWSRSITNDREAVPSSGGVMNISSDEDFDEYLWRHDSYQS